MGVPIPYKMQLPWLSTGVLTAVLTAFTHSCNDVHLPTAYVYLCSRDHTDAVASVAPSPQGTLFVSSSWDSTVRVWPTGKVYLTGKSKAYASYLPSEQAHALEVWVMHVPS